MSIYNSLQFHGIGIAQGNTTLQGISLTTDNTAVHGITINAGNFFNESITVTDPSGTAIQGATVNIVSTQTHPNNYEGDITVTTNSDGTVQATGSSTTGTTVTVTKENFQDAIVPLNGLDYIFNSSQTIVMYPPTGSGSTSKKLYTTNKGNILINPNDTILIELD